MEIPIMLIIFTIPSALYIVFQKLRGQEWKSITQDLGWTLGKGQDYLRALGVFLVVACLAWGVFKFIPMEMIQTNSHYDGWKLSAGTLAVIVLREAFYLALGEEIFFRGFLGGFLIRKLGFAFGNLIQAILFLLLHLPLLQLGSEIWPVFIVQFAAGWLQGWLRYKSDSILPGWLVHILSNVSGAISVIG